MIKAVRRTRASHEPSDHAKPVWVRSTVSFQTRHLRKVVFSSGKSLSVLTTVSSSWNRIENEILETSSPEKQVSKRVWVSPSSLILLIVQAFLGSRIRVPATRMPSRLAAPGRAKLIAVPCLKNTSWQRAVRHPSTLEALQRGRRLRANLGRHTQTDASQSPL